jgi:carbon storage regulator
MLILSRREGDSILIGDGVRLVVLSVDRRGVRIGIEAPPEVRILRGEIVSQIAEENRRAHTAPQESDWLDVLPTRPKA